MKRKVFQWIGLCLVLLFSACTQQNNYVNVLPADATAVASVHLPTLIKKSGISDEEMARWTAQVGKLVKDSFPMQNVEVLAELIASPEQSGINWNKEIFLFMHPAIHHAGLLASVADCEKLTEMLTSVVSEKDGKPLIEKEGYRLTLIDDRLALAYSDEALLLVEIPMEVKTEHVHDLLAGWMKASGVKSFPSTASFKKLSEAEGDIKLVASMDMLPQKYAEMALSGMSEGFLLKDVQSLVTICFEKGELLVRAESFGSGDQVKRTFSEAASLYEGKTSGKFLAEFPEDVMLWLNTTVDGEKWCEALLQQPLVEEQLKQAELPVDFKKCITALKGEIALGISLSSRIPEVGLFAEVKDDAFFEELASVRAVLGLLGFQCRVDQGVFSLTNYQEGAVGLLKNAARVKDSEDKLFFLTLDMKSLQTATPFLSASESMAVGLLAAYIDEIQIYSSEVQSGCLAVKAVDKNTNILKQCVDLVKKMAADQ